MLLGVALLAAGCSSTPGATASQDGAPSNSQQAGIVQLAEGSSARTVTVDGTTRHYLAYRPAGLNGPAPLVLAFHGYGGSAEGMEQSFGWDEEADRNAFVVVYPDGTDRSFNAGTCCGTSVETGVDDVAAAEAMIDDVSAAIAVDPDRVYVTGFSNGGMMSYRLACESARFAAIAPVAGTQLVDCTDRSTASVLHIHGTADTVVPAGGSDADPSVYQAPSIEEVMSGWRDFLGCSPATEETGGRTITSAATCPDGRDVDYISVDGLDHAWPTETDGLDATGTIWQFFADHRR